MRFIFLKNVTLFSFERKKKIERGSNTFRIFDMRRKINIYLSHRAVCLFVWFH